jgi:hypothetical protein
MRECGILLWFVALNPGALRLVQCSAPGGMLGRERLLFNLWSVGAGYRSQNAAQQHV